ncbi:MAG: Hsp20/alpha crystallin family protein [Candidatus Omnitrophica bacterium]|nr:Hsp20/alpha crystallin family protein [Candidatus Omnitrophota bacterium]
MNAKLSVKFISVFVILTFMLLGMGLSGTLNAEARTNRQDDQQGMQGAPPPSMQQGMPQGLGPGQANWDPLTEVDQVQRKMENFMRNQWPRWRQAWQTGNMPFYPTLDIVDSKEAYVVTADMPGMSKDMIHVEVKNQILTISGERTEQTKTEKEDYYMSERSFGEFERSVELPEKVIVEKVSAKYENGVLEITLPKAEPEKSKDTVKVKVL